MAAAIIPLFAGLAPELINLIVGLIHKAAPAAEELGPATGPVKFGEVFADVVSKLTTAAAAGAIAKTLPPDDTIRIIIQAVVTSMQLSGSLGTPTAGIGTVVATVPSSPRYALSPGASILITA